MKIILYKYTVVKISYSSGEMINLLSTAVVKTIHIIVITVTAPKKSPTMNLRTVNTSMLI